LLGFDLLGFVIKKDLQMCDKNQTHRPHQRSTNAAPTQHQRSTKRTKCTASATAAPPAPPAPAAGMNAPMNAPPAEICATAPPTWGELFGLRVSIVCIGPENCILSCFLGYIVCLGPETNATSL
jgi:hypothetical protein